MFLFLFLQLLRGSKLLRLALAEVVCAQAAQVSTCPNGCLQRPLHFTDCKRRGARPVKTIGVLARRLRTNRPTAPPEERSSRAQNLERTIPSA